MSFKVIALSLCMAAISLSLRAQKKIIFCTAVFSDKAVCEGEGTSFAIPSEGGNLYIMAVSQTPFRATKIGFLIKRKNDDGTWERVNGFHRDIEPTWQNTYIDYWFKKPGKYRVYLCYYEDSECADPQTYADVDLHLK